MTAKTIITFDEKEYGISIKKIHEPGENETMEELTTMTKFSDLIESILSFGLAKKLKKEE